MNFNISKMVYSRSFQSGRIQPKSIVKNSLLIAYAGMQIWIYTGCGNDCFIFQIIDSFIGGTLDLAWLWVLKTLLEVLLRDGVCLLSEYKGAKAMSFLSDARQPEVRAFSFRLKMQKVYFRLTCVASSSLFSNLPRRLSKNDGKWLVPSWLLSLVKL